MYYRIHVDNSLPLLEFTRTFSDIPKEATILDLSNNEIGDISRTWEKLEPAFAKIPRTITGLNLNNNFLYRHDSELIQYLRKTPTSIVDLSLARNRLRATKNATLDQVFALFPNLRTLNLNGNSLSYYDTEENFLAAFAALPMSLTSLDLSHNSLYSIRSPSLLAQAFALFPKTLTHLNIAGNQLGSMPCMQLAQVLHQIPPGVTALDLRMNDLEEMSSVALQKIFAALPEHVKTLTLGIRDVEKRTREELIALGKALPHVMKLHVLDAEDQPSSHIAASILKNHIGRAHVEAYRVLHEEQQIPKALVGLVMEYNAPFKSDEIASFVTQQRMLQGSYWSELSPNIFELNLRGHCFKYMTTEEVSNFFAAIPEQIKTITLDFDDIAKRTKEELIAITSWLYHDVLLWFLEVCWDEHTSYYALRLLHQHTKRALAIKYQDLEEAALQQLAGILAGPLAR